MSHFHYVKGPHAHTHSVWLYWGVFAALVCLTVLTVVLADVDFGVFNMAVTIGIAGAKSSLVLLVFMHLWFDNKFYTVVILSSFVFLGLFLLFTLIDLNSRDWVGSERAYFLPRDEIIYKHRLKNPDALPLRPGLREAELDKLIFKRPHGH